MVINAQKGQGGSKEKEDGNRTVAQVCPPNKLTFRNICYWAFISFFLSLRGLIKCCFMDM